MKKEFLQTPLNLAGFLLGINIILYIIFSTAFAVFMMFLPVFHFITIGKYVMLAVAGILGATAVGWIYADSFKEIMPKKLRINVVAIYIFDQVAFGLLCSLVWGVPNFSLFVGILIAASLIYPVFVYILIGSGGKAQLKAIQKKEAAKKQ